MSRVKNELGHRKIVRDVTQISFGYVFFRYVCAHVDKERRPGRIVNALTPPGLWRSNVQTFKLET